MVKILAFFVQPEFNLPDISPEKTDGSNADVQMAFIVNTLELVKSKGMRYSLSYSYNLLKVISCFL